MFVRTETPTGISFSVGYVAAATGLSRSTIRRMIEQGKLDAWQTPGGHQRIADHDVARLVWSLQTPAVKEATTEIIRGEAAKGNEAALNALTVLAL